MLVGFCRGLDHHLLPVLPAVCFLVAGDAHQAIRVPGSTCYTFMRTTRELQGSREAIHGVANACRRYLPVDRHVPTLAIFPTLTAMSKRFTW